MSRSKTLTLVIAVMMVGAVGAVIAHSRAATPAVATAPAARVVLPGRPGESPEVTGAVPAPGPEPEARG